VERAIAIGARVLEHGSATVAFKTALLRKARWLLRHHSNVMLLADVASLTMT